MSELKTCFKKVDYDLSGLLHYIEIGDIALPAIQRPFVWSNAKVTYDAFLIERRKLMAAIIRKGFESLK